MYVNFLVEIIIFSYVHCILTRSKRNDFVISLIIVHIICCCFLQVPQILIAVVSTLKIGLTVPRRYSFCGSFIFFLPAFAMPSWASVYMCPLVTCWERADIFALVCGV